MPTGRDRTEGLLRAVLDRSDAAETRVTLGGGRLHVVRFADNLVRESVEERLSVIDVQLAYWDPDGWLIGQASTTETHPKGIEEVLAWARADAIARGPAEDYAEQLFPDDFESVIGDSDAPFDTRTATAGPVLIADQIGEVVLPCYRTGLSAEGAYAVGVGTIGLDGRAGIASVANSNGLMLHYLPTRVWVMGSIRSPDGGLGRFDTRHSSLFAIDLATQVERAVTRAELAPVAVPPAPGPVRVLLEPAAVSALLDWLRPQFSFRAAVEGHSVLTERLGERVFGDAIDISANPTHPALLGRPFDADGWPRRELSLIEAGVPVRLVYTRPEAAREGVTPTGYADTPERGAVVEHLVMAGGAGSVDELLADLGVGLLVGHLGPFAAEHEGSLTLAGFTADDTYVVRDGRLVGLAGPLRFRVDLADLLSRVIRFGEPIAAGDNVAPPLVADGLEVTG